MDARRGIVLACALTVSARADANGTPETFAPDPRTLGMAHADAADTDGPSLAHTNPGAVSRARTARLFGAYSLSVPALGVTLEKDNEDPALAPAEPAPVTGLFLGAVLPISVAVPDRLAFGFSAYFPTQVLIRARAHDPARPFFYRYDSQTEHYDISVALALNVVEWFSFGGGARLTAGQSGTIDLASDIVRGRLTHQSIDTFQYAVFSPTAGALIGPFGVDGVVTGSLGLVWREPTQFAVDLPASLAVEGAEINAVLDVLVQTNYAPRTIAAGLAFSILEQLHLNVDVAYQFWSLAPPPYVAARVDLSGRTLEEIGLDDTLDAPAEGEERVVSPGFEDTLVLKIGVEGRLLNDVLALRGGYQLRPTPVPDQTSGTNIIDARAHIIGLGLGVRAALPVLVAQPVDFDLGYQAQLLEPRVTEKLRPNDEVGPWRAEGVVHALACGVTYRF